MVKTEILSLLSEIKNIFDENGIAYCISGELAYLVYRNQPVPDDFTDASIIIHASDVNKVIGLLDGREYRKVESLKNNRMFPGYYLRYMNTDTTLLNNEDKSFHYKSNSLGVDIEILCGRKPAGTTGKVFRALKLLWIRKNRAYYLKKNRTTTFKKKVVLTISNMFFNCLGSQRVMKKLFNKWTSLGSSETKQMELARNNGQMIKLDRNLFSDRTTETIDGEEFAAASDLKEFIKNYFKGDFRFRPRSQEICSVSVPWEHYQKVLREQQINPVQSRKEQLEYSEWKVNTYEPARAERTYYYNVLFASGERMNFHRLYNKDLRLEITELYNNENYEQVMLKLNEYIKAVKSYVTKKIGLCFDRQMFLIAVHMMLIEIEQDSDSVEQYRKEAAKVLKVITDMPYQYFDSIENVFFGSRENTELLMEYKKEFCSRITDISERIGDKYCKGDER